MTAQALLSQGLGACRQGLQPMSRPLQHGNGGTGFAQAQQRLTSAKLTALNALIDYQLGVADLKRQTHWDFDRNAPVEPIMRSEE